MSKKAKGGGCNADIRIQVSQMWEDFHQTAKRSAEEIRCECGAVADKIVSFPAWRYDHTVKGD